MIKAAGIIFRVRGTGEILFLQRAAGGDHAGEWVPPGGKVEGDETREEAAIRESVEEAGPKAKAAVKDLKFLARRIAPVAPAPVEIPNGPATLATRDGETCDFTTFLYEIDEPFDVEINDESTAFAWALAGSPPEPLHPGARVALAKLTANELDVARMMAAGDLVSPQIFANVMLLDIRITGTGFAYRKAHDEFCFRAPENYLTPDFLARCSGLPVLWDHPEGATLTSKEYQDRNVGSVFLPYIKGDEVWAICKIYDQFAIDQLTNGEAWSTSPTVDFGAGLVLDSSCQTLEMKNEDGTVDRLLVEGDPPLLDHVAICFKGVWDKGGEPAGVNTAKADSDMADEDDKKREDAAKADKAKADQAKADAENERFSKLMDAVSGLASRMDSWDEEKKKADKAKADADEETKKANEAADEPGAGDPDKVAKKAADSKKSDMDEDEMAKSDKAKADKAKADEDEKKRDDAAKADKARADADLASMRREIDELKRLRAAATRSDDDFNAIGAAQARADGVYHLMGKQAPRPYADESLMGYRRRLANELKAHSKTWNKTDMAKLGDADTFAAVETSVYADADLALRNPATVPAGELRAVTRRVGEHNITEYHGEPKAWMAQFGGYRGSVKDFKPAA